MQFRGAFDIEKQDAGFESQFDFRHGLANAGEYNFGRGFRRGPAYTFEFSPRNDIEACSLLRDQPQNRQRRICLHRITNGVRDRAECFIERLQVSANRPGGINVERRAMARG